MKARTSCATPRRPGSCGRTRIAAVERLAAALDRDAPGEVVSITIAENLAATERAAHLELAPRARVTDETLERIAAEAQLAGLSAQEPPTGRAPADRLSRS